jgi:ribosomal protein S4
MIGLDFPIISLVIEAGFADTKSKSRRMIEQGAVKIDDQVITHLNATVTMRHGMVVRVGHKAKEFRCTFEDFLGD